LRRQQHGAGKAPAESAIGLDRTGVRRQHEQDRGDDAVFARLLDKTDLVGNREKRHKRLMAEIDDLGGAVVGDQPVEQCHLPADIAYASGRCVLRQKLCQRAFPGVEIKAGDRVAFMAEQVAHIAAQHEGIIRRFAAMGLVGDDGNERRAGDLDLLASHLIELGDGDLDRAFDAAEIGIVGFRIPLEDVVLLMKFFTRK
jgi:hypothetical protein